ncbi:alpha/beta hydrolase [Crossiella cryophila]|uniref:Pimeloyl-ACP methyl ester carboxylesterase n=1 Tax=Crossiella cryophila TaxID=43355 RepID=A0A7W7CFT1_9PSEU|nr:alpha/beta fold hydrolase [Crossiella cryophila]MBB4680440.1 pimeloyl-ACP methyl ester carboxylesterase [Crossiella cryophila]
MRGVVRTTVTALLAVACAAGAGIPATAAQPGGRPRPVACQEITIETEPPGLGRTSLRGELCRPAGVVATVQLLLGGLTYDRHYWTTSPDGSGPSYQRSANNAGLATLALDRLGTGNSDRPAADKVGFDAQVVAVEQVVAKVLAGVRGQRYQRIVLVGHSFGAGIALAVATRRPEVTGVVLSGYAHAAGPKLAEFGKTLVAAKDDPVTGPANPPEGYLTTRAGSRSEFFFNPGNAVPSVIARDEADKSTTTTGEQTSLGSAYDIRLAAAVKTPVLIALGQQDQLFCGGQWLRCSSADEVREYESRLFTGGARLSTVLLPDSGHALNLHRNSADFYAGAQAWIAAL